MIGRVLNGRYTLEQEVARGGQATTWRARNSEGDVVLVKALELANLEDWKGIELFEREVQILRNLSHPGIPKYIDNFEEGQGAGRSFYLVQEYFDGPTLREAGESGVLGGADVERIFGQLMEVLSYLHGHSPPVVHRDIKPANIILDMRNGRVGLVDFGAVQLVQPRDIGGSTIVGTAGFMAPEQLMGKGEPASDWFALGATMVSVLTKQNPADLPASRMKMQWRPYMKLKVSESFANQLDRFVEPHPQDRHAHAPVSPTQALVSRSLHGEEPALRIGKPRESLCTITRTGDRIEIDVPGRPANSIGNALVVLGAMALFGTYVLFPYLWYVLAFAALLLLGGVMGIYLDHRAGRELTQLVLAPEGYTITQFRRRKDFVRKGPITDFQGLSTGGRVSTRNEQDIFARIDGRDAHLGSARSSDEVAWLNQETRAFQTLS